MPAFLVGPMMKLAGIAVVVMAMWGLYLGLQHFRAVAAAETKLATAAQAQVAADLKDHERIVKAFEASNTEEAARNARIVIIRKVIHDASTTDACARSPAIAAVLAGLHTPTPAAAHALPGAGAAAAMPAAAGTASATHH